MRVAFVGKGGAGKTSLAALLSRFLAAKTLPVMAVDVDINQNLAVNLGMSASEAAVIPAVGLEKIRLQTYLKGDNHLIDNLNNFIKTTPPGRGSNLLKLKDNNSIWSHFAKKVNGVSVLATGPFDESDLGVRCYHSKTGAVEMLLNHLIDGVNEYMVLDMTAGADTFASGMFTKFDLTVMVVEPTTKSIAVYQQYKQHARGYNINIKVVGNKIETAEELAMVQAAAGKDFLTSINYEPAIKKIDQGLWTELTDLSAETITALEKIKHEIDKQTKDWDKYLSQSIEFHNRNAEGWANAQAGADLTMLVDHQFKYQDHL